MSAPAVLSESVSQAVPDTRDLRELVGESLEPLFARLNAVLVDHFLVELEAWVREARQGVQAPPGLRLARLAAIQGAIQAAHRSRYRVSEWRTGLDLLRERVAQSTVEDEAHTLILQFLAQIDPRGVNLAEDRKALKRWMDLKAVEERVLRQQTSEENLQEIALRAAGALCADEARAMSGRGGPPQDLLRQLFEQTGVLGFLRQYLGGRAHWRLAVAALHALGAILKVLPPEARKEQVDLEAFQSVYRLSLLDDSNVWVQRQALETLVLFDLDEALQAFKSRLEAGAQRRDDDLFVRRKIVDLLADFPQRAEAYNLLSGVLVRKDKSEHVRVGVVQALARMPLTLCAGVLEEVLGQAKGIPGDPCAQVRTAAYLAALQKVAPGGLDLPDNKWIFELTLRALQGDPDMLFTRALLERLPRLASQLTGPVLGVPPPIQKLLQAVDALMARKGVPLLLLRTAQEAREALIVTRLPAFPVVVARLQGSLEQLEDGDRFRVATSDLAADPPVLGRILAHLSRDDFGFHAEIRGETTTIQKGDSFGAAPWRLLHELFHPSPDKRQGWFHHVGRKPFGQLRAHPLTLGEQSMTKVPGERYHMEIEGQWRRYLPLVDDCFSLAQGLVAPVHVHLFSSQGITTLSGPRGLWPKLRLYLKLTWRYAHYAALRNVPVTQEDQLPARRYLDALRELGVETTFSPHAYVAEGAYHALKDPTLETIFGPAKQAEEAPKGAADART
ncbi:MAG: hypothetical protein HS116_20200 [Planctomycetes bacterium]|nr:hypothetical protein [Planctomycetota bacterium]